MKQVKAEKKKRKKFLLSKFVSRRMACSRASKRQQFFALTLYSKSQHQQQGLEQTTMAFRWSQNPSTVTITFPVAPSVKKSDVEVSVVNTQLRAGVRGSVPLCEGTLTAPVRGFKWSLKAGIVSIQLEKGRKVQWNDLLVCFYTTFSV